MCGLSLRSRGTGAHRGYSTILILVAYLYRPGQVSGLASISRNIRLHLGSVDSVLGVMVRHVSRFVQGRAQSSTYQPSESQKCRKATLVSQYRIVLVRSEPYQGPDRVPAFAHSCVQGLKFELV